ncbi:class C sortase [Brevibacterium moorei]|uniref:class C sortase n=1 Tax=Brevibacterium moorei TaxID=2968457 RepID=UPI00211C677C|nr:class C sortase [Brevibacterium sp. 68QC2CO]MCQ9386538.1 class C sortase [Brevibacterium sp. 68QC2CO]
MSDMLTQRRRPAKAGLRRWRFPKLPAFIAVVALVGLSVWTYPSVAAWFNQLDQSKIVEEAGTVHDGAAKSNAEQLKAARAYNEQLEFGATLEAGHRIPSGRTPAAGEDSRAPDVPTYDEALNDGRSPVMSRLRIPKIDLDLPIYHGTSDETLLKGLGHLQGTSLPVGGADTHAVITGHRGLAEATMFTNLDRIDKGDHFTLTTFGEVLAYQVISTKVVDPDQTESLRPEAGKDLVTLVTCTPLGINSQRILVTAQRIFPTPPADQEAGTSAPNVPGFPWWVLILGGGLLAAIGYVWWAGRPVTPRGSRH